MIKAIRNTLLNAVPDSISVPVRFAYHKLFGRPEPEQRLLNALVRPGTTVADIGANNGTYVYALAPIAHHGHAFEPIPRCAELLRAYGANNVTIPEVALSDMEGFANLSCPTSRGETILSRAHLSPAAEKSASVPVGENTIRVRSTKLDGFGFTNISFLKLDVEEHELSVLKGQWRLFCDANRICSSRLSNDT